MPESVTKPRYHGWWRAVLVPSFYLTEWLLVSLSAAVYAGLRSQGLSTQAIWLLLWAANLAISGGFVLCNDRWQVDLTLMEGLRRLINATGCRRHWLGRSLEIAIFVRLLIWDGPCQLLIFFRERLPSRAARMGFFIATSGLQMLLWSQLYAVGYDHLGALLNP